MNVARELAAVPVAQDRNVEQPERSLRGAVHLARQQNRARARAEKRAAVGSELFQRVEEALLGENLQMCAALAARKNDAVQSGKVPRQPHERVLGAEPLQHPGVRLVVSLYRKYPDFHFSRH